MTQKTIKCFVAMAFGHLDCDLIYDRQILPILTKLKVMPIRVDRKQHRDDLNNFIIRMIKECDIVLADLTYTRPSVYYEAGFAERSSPVVYTVRTDHLSRSQPDEQLRVHFDLEMKKIVAWKAPNDKTFSKRLKARLIYLLKPIIIDHTEKEKAHLEKQNFSKFSISERCMMVEASISSELKKKNFFLASLADIDRSFSWKMKHSIVFIGAKRVRNVLITTTTIIADTITKTQIEFIRDVFYEGRFISGYGENITRYDTYFYFCTLRKTPLTRLTSVFPYAKPEGKLGLYSFSHTKSYGDKETVNTKIWLISPIESEKIAKQIAEDIAAGHRKEKTNAYAGLSNTSYGKRIVFTDDESKR
jgi:nucleoside 2-deoxyribosyltransferase